MKKYLLLLFALLTWRAAYAKTFYVTVSGLGGEPEYEQRFSGLADEADKSVHVPGSDSEVTTLKGSQATKSNVKRALEQISQACSSRDTLVLLLIGHGSFDGSDYKMNLPGPDLKASELAELLNHIPAARQLVVDTTSASGSVLKPLEHPGRLIVTATRDGAERNATVFARFWVEALHDSTADLDKNEVITAQEAFNFAQKKTSGFYQEQKRIATEHPTISDSGRAGTFPVVRLGTNSALTDPAKKPLVSKRDELEAKIDLLKQQKNSMAADDYKKQLTAFLVELARTQGEIDK